MKRESQGAVTAEGQFGEKIITEVPIRFYASKNKLSEPFRVAYGFLNLDKNKKLAYNPVSDVIAFGQEYGVIDVSGAWVYFKDTKGNEIHKENGNAKAIRYLNTNINLYSQIKFLIYSKLYRPYEFYYLYDKIVKMINAENKIMIQYYKTEETPLDVSTIYPINKIMTQEEIDDAKAELVTMHQVIDRVMPLIVEEPGE